MILDQSGADPSGDEDEGRGICEMEVSIYFITTYRAIDGGGGQNRDGDSTDDEGDDEVGRSHRGEAQRHWKEKTTISYY
jgi:hypothetical protein